MIIYGKEDIINTFTCMRKSGRLPHSYLIYGGDGLGKKTLAGYFAMLLLCEEQSESPCSECFSCKNSKAHPDIIEVPHSGKLQGFAIGTIKEICMQAHIKPSNAAAKVYIFSDADNISIQAQNTLLKLIEEPPDFVYFIFTAETKEIFLPTVISRVVSFLIPSCTDDETVAALRTFGYTDLQINEAKQSFGGNIGKCIDFIENNNKLRDAAELTKRITDAIIKKDEYEIIKSFSVIEGDRNAVITVLHLLDAVFRDTLICSFSDNYLSCYPEGALRLAKSMPFSLCCDMHLKLCGAYRNIDSNVNIKLVIYSLCGNFIGG